MKSPSGLHYGWIILVTLLLLDRKRRVQGFIMAVFFMMYGVARFLVDFVRYYNYSLFEAFGVTWTINQAISLGMFIAGLLMLILLPRFHSKSTVADG